MNATLITGPLVEPITLAEAKLWLKVDATDDDPLISSLITAARQTLEKATRLQFIAQSWRLFANQWPLVPHSGLNGWAVELPLAPVSSVSTILIYDQYDVPTALASSSYRLNHSQTGPRLVFSYLPTAPSRVSEGISVDVIAGFGSLATDVPEPLRHAIRLLVAHLYMNRGDENAALPASVAALIAPYRRLAVRT